MSAPNISRIEVTEKFCFRTVTLKELYDAIDSLDKNKSPGPGVFNAWAIKAAKFAIGTHLQFVFNTCISQNIFPENLKLLALVRSTKKGMWKFVRTIGLSQLLQCLQNSLSVYFSIRLTNLCKKKKPWTVHSLDFKNISLLQMLFYT